MSGHKTIADLDDEYAWLIETSDDGDTWSQEHHPVHGRRDSGGIERAACPEDLAREVLARRFALLRGDDRYDWEELWFRATVWDFRACADYASWQQPPYLPEQCRFRTPQSGDLATRVDTRHGSLNHSVAEQTLLPARQTDTPDARRDLLSSSSGDGVFHPRCEANRH